MSFLFLDVSLKLIYISFLVRANCLGLQGLDWVSWTFQYEYRQHREDFSVWRIGGQIKGFEILSKSILPSCYFCFLRFLVLKNEVHNPKIWQATEKMSSCCLLSALIFQFYWNSYRFL